MFIVGPPAVGKMTVGQELAKLTGFKLFYNHRIIDLLTDYFPFGSDGYNRLVSDFYDGFFEEAAKAGTNLIATLGWDFSSAVDEANMRRLTGEFLDRGGHAMVVELGTSMSVRLERNRSLLRRAHKKVEWATDEELRRLDVLWQTSSNGNFPLDVPRMVIDNTNIPPEEAAAMIRERFNLPLAANP